jgi:hypothetical protein
LQHQEGIKWVDGAGKKHSDAEMAYLGKQKRDQGQHDLTIPAMSHTLRQHLRHIITTMGKVAHFVGEYELPVHLARPLCDLIADCASHAPSVADYDKYQNRAQATAIMEQVGDIIQEQLIASIKASPLYGLGFDESTDLGDRQNLALVFSWVDPTSMKRLESFIHLEDLHGNASGEALTSAIIDFLKGKGIDLV